MTSPWLKYNMYRCVSPFETNRSHVICETAAVKDAKFSSLVFCSALIECTRSAPADLHTVKNLLVAIKETQEDFRNLFTF